MSWIKAMMNTCESCNAKDSEIGFLTNHIRHLTELIEDDHNTIIALKHELLIEKKRHANPQTLP